MAKKRSRPTKGARRYAKRARRTLGRKKRQVRNRVSVPVGLGFPKRMVMTHKYCEQVTLNTGVGGVTQYYNFNCNSLYDPNSTGTGHQPLYFDQVASIYDHYVVIGAKMVVRWMKTDGTASAPTTVGCYINDDTTVTPSFSAGMEQSQGRHRVLTAASPKTTFAMKWSCKKAFGGSILANTELQGTSAANPTEQQYFTIVLQDPEFAAVTATVFTVVIEYDAIFEELKNLDSS